MKMFFDKSITYQFLINMLSSIIPQFIQPEKFENFINVSFAIINNELDVIMLMSG